MNRGRTSRRRVRKSNPGTLQSDREVVEQFVVRRHEFEVVLETLRENIGSQSCQHVLVVAPRGRGKTMLLARVAAELHGDPALSGELLPVRFMEESHEVSSIADFWLEALFHFAEECSSRYPELARELRGTHASLTGRWLEQGIEELARAAVLSVADRLGRKLVLMVENLQSLCDEVDRGFGWKLRAVLQSQPEVMLLATATSRFDGIENADEPFFELFRTVDLSPLDTDECGRLWETVSGDEVRDREIRPLEILTGGSPRFLVIVAGFARHRSLKRLMEELVSLIDEHTEYFRGNLDSMPKTERRVYIAVIDLWRPSKTGEIAARARVDVRVASTMLGRLVTKGAVVFEGSGKKRLYRAAEGLYSIYYKIRRERDEAGVVEGLLRVMAVLYNESERPEIWCELRREADELAAIRSGLERFTATHPEGYGPIPPPIRSVAERHSTEKADPADSPPSQEVTNRLEPDTSINEQERHFLGAIGEAMGLDDKASALRELGELETAIGVYDDIVNRFGDTDSANLQWMVAGALIDKGRSRVEQGDFEAGLAAYDQVTKCFGKSDVPRLREQVASALIGKMFAQEGADEFRDSILTCEEVVERFGASGSPELLRDVAWALDGKGRAFRVLGDMQSAEEAYDEVITRFGSSNSAELLRRAAEAWIHKGRMRDRLENFERGVAVYQAAIERCDESGLSRLRRLLAAALIDMAVMQLECGRAEDALKSCEDVEKWLDSVTDGDRLVLAWRMDAVRARAWLAQGQPAAALRAFASAYGSFVPDDPALLREMIDLVTELVAMGVPARGLERTLSADEVKSEALSPLVAALWLEAGDEVRVPVEVREVAQDIRSRIKGFQPGQGARLPTAE